LGLRCKLDSYDDELERNQRYGTSQVPPRREHEAPHKAVDEPYQEGDVLAPRVELQECVAGRTPPPPAWWEGRPNKKAK
jgi:hypothetical protein